MEDCQESKDGVDQHGDDFALLVIEVGAGIATRTDGGVEDRRQLFAESKNVIIYHFVNFYALYVSMLFVVVQIVENKTVNKLA